MVGGNTLEAITQAETTGKLNGLEIEHYVAGGLPPPHYRSEQFRLFVDHGRDTLWFATPDYTVRVKQGEQYPQHVYRLTASPNDVKMIARLVGFDDAGVERVLGEYTFNHTRSLPGPGAW